MLFSTQRTVNVIAGLMVKSQLKFQFAFASLAPDAATAFTQTFEALKKMKKEKIVIWKNKIV